jgi:hypothetical protein
MRLKTIWTLRSMTTMERLRQTGDWSAMKVAGKLPRRIRYWTTLIEIGKATRTSPHVPATPLEDILKNLDGPK